MKKKGSRFSKHRFLLGWGVSYLPFLILSFWSANGAYYAGYMLTTTFLASLMMLGIDKLLKKKISLVVFVILCFVTTLLLNLVLSFSSA